MAVESGVVVVNVDSELSSEDMEFPPVRRRREKSRNEME